MKSAFLLPFMGPLPSYFKFWAKSCEINKDDFHWFVYSDQVESQGPVNAAVTLIPYSFGKMISDFKNFLNIEINNDNSRRICDFRLLFYFLRRDQEQLDRFDFIGYTDMDMVYGRLSRFMPPGMDCYTMISADNGHPCGPFTLMRLDRVRTLGHNDVVRAEMSKQRHRSFNESDEFLTIVADGDAYWCNADALQPMVVPPFNHRQVFSIWNNGHVTVYDNRGHKKDAGFHHFSRYKNRKRFKICGEPENNPVWAVCKRGILPIRSNWTLVKLWMSLIV
jgi:hypothetical protein